MTITVTQDRLDKIGAAVVNCIAADDALRQAISEAGLATPDAPPVAAPNDYINLSTPDAKVLTSAKGDAIKRAVSALDAHSQFTVLVNGGAPGFRMVELVLQDGVLYAKDYAGVWTMVDRWGQHAPAAGLVIRDPNP